MMRDRKMYKKNVECGVKISKEQICSVPLCTHTVEACLCVLGAACVREDLGGKGGSRKLLKVILQPTADSSFPPGAS